MKLPFLSSLARNRRGEIGTIAVLIGMAVIGLGIAAGAWLQNPGNRVNILPRAATGEFPANLWWTNEGTDQTTDDRIDFFVPGLTCKDADRLAVKVYDSRNNNKELGTLASLSEPLNGRQTCWEGKWGPNPNGAYYRFWGTKSQLRLKGLPKYIRANIPSQTQMSGELNLGDVAEIPNCANLTGPTTLTVGQAGTYSATVTSQQGQLTGEIFVNNYSPVIKHQSFSGTSASISGSWTPTAAGTYTIYCRAWNDGIAECRPPNLVDKVPRHQCSGPNYQMTVKVNPAQTVQKGNIKININPPGLTGAQWRMVQEPASLMVWRNSGQIEPNVTAGNVTIEFKPVSGYNTPASLIVTVPDSGTVERTVEYARQVGSLKITIPNAPSGASWRRLGTSTWRTSGYTEKNVPTGSYTIEFSEAVGHTKPANLTGVTVTTNTLTQKTSAAYIATTVCVPTLKTPANNSSVTSNPTFEWSVCSTGAKYQIEVTGGSSPYTVIFTGNKYAFTSPVPSWKAGTTYSWKVKLCPNTECIGGTYSSVSKFTYNTAVTTGTLQVIIGGTAPTGAQWRRTNTTTWRNSGTAEPGVAAGTYTIEFKSVTGYTKPANIPGVAITAGQTTTKTSDAYVKVVDPCPRKSEGDADCNGKIEYVDFICWRGELNDIKQENCVSANFINPPNGTVNIVDGADYSVWFNTFKKENNL